MTKYLTKRNILIITGILMYVLIAIWNNSSFYNLVRWTLYSAVPLAMVAMAGLYSERSGVVNIALEGIMMFGAFIGILTLNNLQHNNIDGQLILILSVIIGGIAGVLFSLLHSFASVTMKSNQVISGTALNMLSVALAIFVGRAMSSSGTEEIGFTDNYKLNIPILKDIPFIGDVLFTNVYLITLLGLFIFGVAAVIAYKTKYGLRLRACGENPHAADAAGINVYKIRYLSVSISGLLAGMGGVILIVSTSTSFKASIYGYGFLALAVLISGQWKPTRVLVFSLLFGFMMNLSNGITLVQSAFDNLRNDAPMFKGLFDNLYLFFRYLPRDIISMTPFIVTLILLALTSKNSQGPKAAGEPYDQGKR